MSQNDVIRNESPTRGWSDRKADAVAVLVIFTALLLGAVFFVSAGG